MDEPSQLLKNKRIFLLIFFFFLWSPPVWSIENNECLDCHGDTSLVRQQSEGMKEGLYVNNSQFILSVHNINGITCVDCHADIEKLEMDKDVPHATSLKSVDCSKCHEAEAKAYVNSVHKKAGGKGITIPCYACHGYHYVSNLEAESVIDRENGFCLKCHNPEKFHSWLPQMDTHFNFVECTVCHAENVPLFVNLRFWDFSKKRFLSGTEILTALKTNSTGFMPLIDKNKDNKIDADEFEQMVFKLRENNVFGTFHGELIVDLVPVVHHVNRGKANRECEQCHNPISPLFEDVVISLNKEDGDTDRHVVDRSVLSTYYVNHFYAIGGTRVRLLDKIGVAIVVGGISVVFGHLLARIVTIPTRTRRKEKEKEKKYGF